MNINLLTAVIGLLTSLPEIVKFAELVMSYLNRASAGNPIAFLKELNGVMASLSAAKTPEEHSNAAKALSDLIGRMPLK